MTAEGSPKRTSRLVLRSGLQMRLSFGDCVFDSDTREVFRAGRPLPVPPKAFAMLELLIRRRPKAVSKEEIHKLLWPETFVSDANLPNLVAELRSALGDDARSPHIIRTVQRYGYAFSADVAGEPQGHPGSPVAYRLIWGDREVALKTGRNLIGRDEDAVVWIDDALVSRRHARIVIDESGAVLEDLGSKNGTYLRGERIRSAVRLTEGDLLGVGPASMTFRVLTQTASTASAIDLEKRTGSR